MQRIVGAEEGEIRKAHNIAEHVNEENGNEMACPKKEECGVSTKQRCVQQLEADDQHRFCDRATEPQMLEKVV